MLAGTDAGTGVRGHVWVWGGDSAVQSHSVGGVRGGEEGHTQEHTHTQERTRECCTYPLATYPLKSARVQMIAGSSASYLARTPCVPLFSTLFNRGVETEGLLDYEGRAGIISIVRRNLRPVIFGVDPCCQPTKEIHCKE